MNTGIFLLIYFFFNFSAVSYSFLSKGFFISLDLFLGSLFLKMGLLPACILSIVKQITSPGGMHETSARAWCTVTTQRNQVEREVGGGIRMGNTGNSMADSCQCMTNPLQCCEVISLQLIKINEKKKRKWDCFNFYTNLVFCTFTKSIDEL